MSSSTRLKSTLLPIAEHRQARVCDSSVLQGAAASQQQARSSSRERQLKVVLGPLVRLKDAFAGLMVSEGSPQGRSSAACCPMGVVMGPVDFGGYEAVSSILTRNHKHDSYHQLLK